MTPNRVNRAPWPTKENRQTVHGKNRLGWPKWGWEGFFPANPDLADIWGDMDFDFENFHFVVFDSGFLDFQVPRFPRTGLGRGPGWPSGTLTWAAQMERCNIPEMLPTLFI